MDTIETLTARITALEDRQAIADLIAGYGPAVNSLDGAGAAVIWARDGVYQIGPGWTFDGRAAITALPELPQHRGYVAQGCTFPVAAQDRAGGRARNCAWLFAGVAA